MSSAGGSRAHFGATDDAPGKGADRNGLQHLEARDVDDRDVIGDAIGGQQIFLVRREGEMPDALADEQIFFDLSSSPRRSRRRDWPGRARRRRACRRSVKEMPIGWIASFDRPGISKRIFCFTLWFAGSMTATVPPISDDTQSSEPSGLKAAKRGRASTSTLATICLRLRVDEMRHIGRLGRIDENASVRAHRHAFRLDADRHVADRRLRLRVDHGDEIVVLVRHIDRLAVRAERHQLGIGAGGQIAGDLAASWCRAPESCRRRRRRYRARSRPW